MHMHVIYGDFLLTMACSWHFQEAQLENLQDQMMGGHENRSVSNMSFADSELDLESAYGSTSARSSFR